MRVAYHIEKANMLVDALCQLSMESVSHIQESKRNLVKDINRLAHLGVRIEDSSNGGMMVNHNSEFYFVVKISMCLTKQSWS